MHVKRACLVLPKQALREQAGVLLLPRIKGSLRSHDSERKYSSIFPGWMIAFKAFMDFATLEPFEQQRGARALRRVV